MAMSNAMFFRVARVQRVSYIPLGLVAPIAIYLGVLGSRAARPLLGDAADSARAGDFMAAGVTLAVFLALSLVLGKWKGGQAYGIAKTGERGRDESARARAA
ncbi:MAG: hypothetical protein FJ318_09540 [SAR202 cluster bacterium]|nr:hypothetical protein [SAR202 cluster bacterium]